MLNVLTPVVFAIVAIAAIASNASFFTGIAK